MTNATEFQIGDPIKIKEGVEEVETGLDMSGWRGRVKEIKPEDNLVLMAFDSITLKQLPADYLHDCAEKGYGWSEYYLYADDALPAQPRDTKADVEEAIAEIEDQLGWAYLGEEGRAINDVLGDALNGDRSEQLKAWEKYLRKSLSFPFQAVVTEWQRPDSPIGSGDRLRVLRIADISPTYGVLAQVRTHRKFIFPFCDLEAADKNSPNHDPLQLYAVWYANR